MTERLWPCPVAVLKETGGSKDLRVLWGLEPRLTAARLEVFLQPVTDFCQLDSPEFQQCDTPGWKACSAQPAPADIECCHVFPQSLAIR